MLERGVLSTILLVGIALLLLAIATSFYFGILKFRETYEVKVVQGVENFVPLKGCDLYFKNYTHTMLKKVGEGLLILTYLKPSTHLVVTEKCFLSEVTYDIEVTTNVYSYGPVSVNVLRVGDYSKIVFGYDCSNCVVRYSVSNGGVVSKEEFPGLLSLTVVGNATVEFKLLSKKGELKGYAKIYPYSDTDGDGLNSFLEGIKGSSDGKADTDGDGLNDYEEVVVYRTDPSKPDTDGDSVRDKTELILGTSPLNPDTDGDGISDKSEIELKTSPCNKDTDGDGLDDGVELKIGTDPRDPDTDKDGLLDGKDYEIADPLNYDTDGDGIPDGKEFKLGMDPKSEDSDHDGLSDGKELRIGTDPTSPDTDGDGLSDYYEYYHGLDPTSSDTDGDGLSDKKELDLGTNPRNPDSDGDGVPDGEDQCPLTQNIGEVILKVPEPYEIDRACVQGDCSSKIIDRDIYIFEFPSNPPEVYVKAKVMLCKARTIFNVCTDADYWEIDGRVGRDESTSLCNWFVCIKVTYKSVCPQG